MVSDNSKPLVNSSQNLPSRRVDRLQRCELIVALVLTAIVLFLLIVRTFHAGPLDRDECDALHLARMPSWADLFANLQYTAFPVLFPATVRTYSAIFGTSDLTLRCFGLAVGIIMVALAWFHSRNLHHDVPLVFLVLIGLNANFLTTGTFLRGYGLGSVLIVSLFVVLEKFLMQTEAKRVLAVFLLALTSAQVLFFNAALIPAIAFGAMVVLFLSQKWKRMWLLGVAVTASLLFYLPYFLFTLPKIGKYAKVVEAPMPLATVGQQLLTACGESNRVLSAFWLGIVLVSLVGAMWRLWVIRKGEPTMERHLLIFAVVVIVACAFTYFVFLRLAHDRLHERHYLAFICILAVAADLIVVNLCRDRAVRGARLIFVVTGILIFPLAALPSVVQRQSNIDLIATHLEAAAHANDLIVVNPPWLGISFGDYYRGQTHWETVPELSDHQLHRYDLFQAKMMEFFPLAALEAKIESTLKSGNRVWFVGKLDRLQGARWPTVLAPAPDPRYGWFNYAYTAAWSEQIGFLVRQHAGHVESVRMQEPPVREWERVGLTVAEGWRY